MVVVNLFERALTSIKAAQILETRREDAVRLQQFTGIAGACALAGVAGMAALSLLGGALPVVRLVVGAATISVAYLVALLVLRVPTEDEHRAVWGLVARLRGLWRTPMPATAGGDA